MVALVNPPAMVCTDHWHVVNNSGDTGSGILTADCDGPGGKRGNILDLKKCCRNCNKNDDNYKSWTDVVLENINGVLTCQEPQIPYPQGCPGGGGTRSRNGQGTVLKNGTKKVGVVKTLTKNGGFCLRDDVCASGYCHCFKIKAGRPPPSSGSLPSTATKPAGILSPQGLLPPGPPALSNLNCTCSAWPSKPPRSPPKPPRSPPLPPPGRKKRQIGGNSGSELW